MGTGINLLQINEELEVVRTCAPHQEALHPHLRGNRVLTEGWPPPNGCQVGLTLLGSPTLPPYGGGAACGPWRHPSQLLENSLIELEAGTRKNGHGGCGTQRDVKWGQADAPPWTWAHQAGCADVAGLGRALVVWLGPQCKHGPDAGPRWALKRPDLSCLMWRKESKA